MWGRDTIPLPRLEAILVRHRGAASAISAKTLAGLLRLSETDGRSIREAVNTLIDQGVPIGSSTHAGHPGYFLIATEAELAAAVGQLRARARECHDRADRLIEAFRVGPRQGSLLGA